MLPGDLPESVTRRAVHADRTSVIWHLADAPDVIAACEEHGTLLRLAAVVHVGSGAVGLPDAEGDWGFGEAHDLVPPPWAERVERAASSARELVERAGPWAESLDSETEAALWVASPVSRTEAAGLRFSAALLVALVGAPLLWFGSVFVAASYFDWRRRLSPDGVLWALGAVAAIGLAGALLTLVAGGVARLRMRRESTRELGAPRRPGESAALSRELSRVGVLAAVLYIWGPMGAVVIGAALGMPARSSNVAGGVFALLLGVSIVGGVAQWRHARST